jgi:hypothetical protein
MILLSSFQFGTYSLHQVSESLSFQSSDVNVTTSALPAVRYTVVPVIPAMITAVAMPAAMREGMVMIMFFYVSFTHNAGLFFGCCRKMNWPVSIFGTPMGTVACT